MKSLVTGGAGFIGSNLIDTLLGIGHTVVCVDNESSDAHDKPYWNNDSINILGDIRDYNLMSSAMKGVDFVFHLAAEARIQPSIENPINAVSINDLGTATVLQCARENQVKKVMFSSTSAAYGRNDSPNVETQYPDPLNPKCLPNKLKEEITETFNNYYKQKQASDIREKDLSRIKHYGYNVINYMNSEDRFDKDWDKFVAYTKTQDKYHNTNVLDIYPEFAPYWY